MEKSRVIPMDNGSKYLAISESIDLPDHDTFLTVLDAKGKILVSKSFLYHSIKNSYFNLFDIVERNGFLFGRITYYLYDAKNPTDFKEKNGYFKLTDHLTFEWIVFPALPEKSEIQFVIDSKSNLYISSNTDKDIMILKLDGMNGKLVYSNSFFIKPPDFKESDSVDKYRIRLTSSIAMDKNDNLLLAGYFSQEVEKEQQEQEYVPDDSRTIEIPINVFDNDILLKLYTDYYKDRLRNKPNIVTKNIPKVIIPPWNVPGFLCKFDQSGKIVFLKGFKSKDKINTLNFELLIPLPDGKLVMLGSLSGKSKSIKDKDGREIMFDHTFIQCNFSDKGVISKSVNVRNFFSTEVLAMKFQPYKEGLIGMISFSSNYRNIYFTNASIDMQKLIFFRNVPGSKSSDFNVEKDYLVNFPIQSMYPLESNKDSNLLHYFVQSKNSECYIMTLQDNGECDTDHFMEFNPDYKVIKTETMDNYFVEEDLTKNYKIELTHPPIKFEDINLKSTLILS